MLTSFDATSQKSLLDFEHCRQTRLRRYDRRKLQGDLQTQGCKRGTCEWCEGARVGVGRDVRKAAIHDGRRIVNASARSRVCLDDIHQDMLVSDCAEEEVEEESMDSHSSIPAFEVALEDLIRPCRRRGRASRPLAPVQTATCTTIDPPPEPAVDPCNGWQVVDIEAEVDWQWVGSSDMTERRAGRWWFW